MGGIPLIAWVLRAVVDSEEFDSVWVSTDDESIKKESLKWGALVHDRSPEVSGDATSSLEAVQEFLLHRPEVTLVGLIQCTSPVLSPDHLRPPCAMMRSGKYDCVFSVVRNHLFRWQEVERGEPTKALNMNPLKRPRRQDWAGELVESGSFYFATRNLIESGALQGGRSAYYEMPPYTDIDIDYPHDWKPAEQRVLKYGYKGKSCVSRLRGLAFNADLVLFDSQAVVTASGDIQYAFDRGDVTAILEAQTRELEILVLSSGNILALDKIAIGERVTKTVLGGKEEISEESAVNAWCRDKGLDVGEVCYLGAEERELGVMLRCGFPVAVGHAHESVKTMAQYSSSKPGGRRAIKDILENYVEYRL